MYKCLDNWGLVQFRVFSALKSYSECMKLDKREQAESKKRFKKRLKDMKQDYLYGLEDLQKFTSDRLFDPTSHIPLVLLNHLYIESLIDHFINKTFAEPGKY